MTSCTVLLLWDATQAALEMTLWPEYFTQGPQQESEKWRKIIKPNSLGDLLCHLPIMPPLRSMHKVILFVMLGMSFSDEG